MVAPSKPRWLLATAALFLASGLACATDTPNRIDPPSPDAALTTPSAAHVSSRDTGLTTAASVPEQQRERATTSSSSAAVPATVALDSVWRKGGAEEEGEMAFGVLADATLDGQLNTYVLDRATSSVRVLNRAGTYLRSIGRSGRGPGEFSSPLSLQHDGWHTLYVLDAVNGLVVINTDRTDLRSSRSIRLPFTATDFCLMNDRIIAYGSHRGHTLHEVSTSGEVLRSFGSYQGPTQHPQHQPAFNDYGKVACFPSADVVVTSTRFFPTVSAYRLATTTMLWSDSLPGFVPYAVLTTPESYIIGQQQRGSDKQYVLRPIDANHVIAQSIRETEAGELIKTCVYNLRDAGCDVQSTTLPALMASRDGYAVSLTENDYWFAALWRLQLRPR